MKYLKLAVSVILISTVITSCSTKSANQGKMVPKEAFVVVVANTKSITSKLNWNDMMQSSWFKEFQKDSALTQWNRKLIDHPELSGIDPNGDQVCFLLKNGDDAQAVFIGDIKDVKTFESANKRFDSTAQPTKDGNLNFLMIHNKTLLSWNDQKFMFIFNVPMKNPSFSMTMDSTSSMQKAPVAQGGTDQLIPLSKRIFSLNSDSSLVHDEKFANLVNEDGDLHIWLNMEQFSKGNMAMGMMSMLKMDKFFDGNVSTATVNFDMGKITIKQKTYASKDVQDIMKKYSGGSVSADMLKNLPSTNVAVAFALHYKPEALRELISLAGMDGMMNVYMGRMGLTMDDFIKANQGDIAFALSDLKIPNTSSATHDSTVSNHPDMNMVFAVAIGDKDAFSKLTEAIRKVSGGAGSDKIIFKNTGQYFVIGNNQKAVDNFLNGNKTAPSFTDKIKDHPAFGFVDLQTILKAIQTASADTASIRMFSLNLATWDNIYTYGGEYSNGAVTATTEINLIDKNTNSLKLLNKYFDQLFPMVKSHMKSTDWSGADSSVVTPPIPNKDN